MEDLSYHSEEEEIQLGNNTYICEVSVTGHRDYDPGDGYNNPPEESYHFVEVVIDKVTLIKNDIEKVMNFPILKNSLSSMLYGEELLASTTY